MTVDTKRLRELEAAATPGGWAVEGRVVVHESLGRWWPVADALGARAGHDAALIAEARNALPALLDRVERLEALLVAVREHDAAREAVDDPSIRDWSREAADTERRFIAAIEARRAALAALEEP